MGAKIDRLFAVVDRFLVSQADAILSLRSRASLSHWLLVPVLFLWLLVLASLLGVATVWLAFLSYVLIYTVFVAKRERELLFARFESSCRRALGQRTVEEGGGGRREVEPIEWLNDVLRKIWQTHVTNILVDQLDTIHKEIDDAMRGVEFEFRGTAYSLRERIRLDRETLSLGESAPQLTHMSVKNEEKAATKTMVVLGTRLVWVSDAHVAIRVQLPAERSLVVHVAKLCVTVAADVSIDFRRDMPSASAVALSLHGAPRFDARVSIGSLDLMLLPAVAHLARSVIGDVLESLIVAPYSLRFENGVVRMGSTSEDDDTAPITDLRVHFSDKEPPVPTGWLLMHRTFPSHKEANLNPSSSTRCFVYYRRDADRKPIRDVCVVMRDSIDKHPNETVPPGFQVATSGYSDNINRGSAGRHVSICFSREGSGPPITSLALAVGSHLSENLAASSSSSLSSSLSMAGGGWRAVNFTASGRWPANLNSGNSGATPLWLCYRGGLTPQQRAEAKCARPLTDLRMISSDRNESVPDGYECCYVTPSRVEADLNKGSGGHFMYVVFKRGGDDPPISNVTFLREDLSKGKPSVAAPPGYQVIKKTISGRHWADCNSGSGGQHLYLAVRRLTVADSELLAANMARRADPDRVPSDKDRELDALLPICDLIVYFRDGGDELPAGYSDMCFGYRAESIGTSGDFKVVRYKDGDLNRRSGGFNVRIAFKRLSWTQLAGYVRERQLLGTADSSSSANADASPAAALGGRDASLSRRASSMGAAALSTLYTGPVTDMAVIFVDAGEMLPENEWHLVRHSIDGLHDLHLNKGSGGRKAVLALRRQPQQPPIVDVGIIFTDRELTSKIQQERCPAGYEEIERTMSSTTPDRERQPANLNAGNRKGRIVKIVYKLGAPGQCEPGDAIVDIGMALDKRPESLPPGWELVSRTMSGTWPADTNAGARSKRSVYVCYLRARNAHLFSRSLDEKPITSLYAVFGEDETVPSHHKLVLRSTGGRSADTNSGATKKKQTCYLAYSKDVGLGTPIYALAVVYDDAGELPPREGNFVPVIDRRGKRRDLNKGAGGRDIYLYYSHDASLAAEPIVDIGIFFEQWGEPLPVGHEELETTAGGTYEPNLCAQNGGHDVRLCFKRRGVPTVPRSHFGSYLAVAATEAQKQERRGSSDGSAAAATTAAASSASSSPAASSSDNASPSLSATRLLDTPAPAPPRVSSKFDRQVSDASMSTALASAKAAAASSAMAAEVAPVEPVHVDDDDIVEIGLWMPKLEPENPTADGWCVIEKTTDAQHRANLNATSGGQTIHLCYRVAKRASAETRALGPITAMGVIFRSKGDILNSGGSFEETPRGWCTVDRTIYDEARADMNFESGGADAYLVYSRQPSLGEPLRELGVIFSDRTPAPANFVKVSRTLSGKFAANINHGSARLLGTFGGKIGMSRLVTKIYLCYRGGSSAPLRDPSAYVDPKIVKK
jgi:hypothetical protein